MILMEPTTTEEEKEAKGPPRCYTVKEVADILGVHCNSVYELVKTGRLGAVRIGKTRMRIPEYALEEFLNPPPKPQESTIKPKRHIVTKIV